MASTAFGAAASERGAARGPPQGRHRHAPRRRRIPATPSGWHDAIHEHPRCELAAVWTHFAVADDPDRRRRSRPRSAAASTMRAPPSKAPASRPERHAANAAGTLYAGATYDLVRPGIAVYGYAPEPGASRADLRPVLSLQGAGLPRQGARSRRATCPTACATRCAARSVIATVPLGYADGVPRRLGETGGEVLVGGRRRADRRHRHDGPDPRRLRSRRRGGGGRRGRPARRPGRRAHHRRRVGASARDDQLRDPLRHRAARPALRDVAREAADPRASPPAASPRGTRRSGCSSVDSTRGVVAGSVVLPHRPATPSTGPSRLSDGGALHVVERGTGRPLVLLHGITLVGAHVALPADATSPTDFRVLAVDHRGHGSSEAGRRRLGARPAGPRRPRAPRRARPAGRDRRRPLDGRDGDVAVRPRPRRSARRERVAGLALVATSATPVHRLAAWKAMTTSSRRHCSGACPRQPAARRPVPDNDLSYLVFRFGMGRAPSPDHVELNRLMTASTPVSVWSELMAGVVGFDVANDSARSMCRPWCSSAPDDLLTPPALAKRDRRRTARSARPLEVFPKAPGTC